MLVQIPVSTPASPPILHSSSSSSSAASEPSDYVPLKFMLSPKPAAIFASSPDSSASPSTAPSPSAVSVTPAASSPPAAKSDAPPTALVPKPFPLVAPQTAASAPTKPEGTAPQMFSMLVQTGPAAKPGASSVTIISAAQLNLPPPSANVSPAALSAALLKALPKGLILLTDVPSHLASAVSVAVAAKPAAAAASATSAKAQTSQSSAPLPAIAVPPPPALPIPSLAPSPSPATAPSTSTTTSYASASSPVATGGALSPTPSPSRSAYPVPPSPKPPKSSPRRPARATSTTLPLRKSASPPPPSPSSPSPPLLSVPAPPSPPAASPSPSPATMRSSTEDLHTPSSSALPAAPSPATDAWAMAKVRYCRCCCSRPRSVMSDALAGSAQPSTAALPRDTLWILRSLNVHIAVFITHAQAVYSTRLRERTKEAASPTRDYRSRVSEEVATNHVLSSCLLRLSCFEAERLRRTRSLSITFTSVQSIWRP